MKKYISILIISLIMILSFKNSFALGDVKVEANGIKNSFDGIKFDVNNFVDLLGNKMTDTINASSNISFYKNNDYLDKESKQIRLNAYSIIYDLIIIHYRNIKFDKNEILKKISETEKRCDEFQKLWSKNDILRKIRNSNHMDDRITEIKNPLPSCSRVNLVTIPYYECIKSKSNAIKCIKNKIALEKLIYNK